MFSFLVIAAGAVLFARSGVLADHLCLAGDFDSQLQYILRSQMLSTQDIANISRLLDDLLPTLNKRWQNYEVFPFGSLTTGLGLKTSDVDIYIRLQKESSLDMVYVLHETDKLFMEQPSLYSDLSYRWAINHVIYKYFHIPSQRRVDIFYKFGDVLVQNSQLVRYYFNLDKRYLALGGVLKIWFLSHGITSSDRRLPNYALYLLIIFYLQQKNIAPSVYLLQRDLVSHFTDKWDTGFNEIPYNSTNTENIHQLLGGFFQYYSQFNFEEYIVSPFAGRPIHRSAFVDIQNFPEEFSSYKYNLKYALQLRIKSDLNISTDLCIQDVFVHSDNPAARLSHEGFTKFKSLTKSVTRLFKELPSDKFLRAFFIVGQYNETDNNQNNSTDDSVRKAEDCIDIN